MRAFAAPLLLLAMTAAAQQLPAGTRDSADHTREAAANASGARLAEAETALEHADYATAIKLLQALAAEQPKDARIAYDLGFAQERSSAPNAEESAAISYAAAIADDEAYPDPRLALGLLDARAGRLDKAHGELASVAQLPSAAPELRARALRALAQLDSTTNPTAASDELLQAIKLTGETPTDTALSASLAAQSGDRSAAALEYGRILSRNPADPDAALGLAHLQLQAGDAARAETTLGAPLAAHPDDFRLLSQMASALATQGKTKEAIALLEKVKGTEVQRVEPAVLRQLARLYALDGNNAQAEVMFKASLAKEPQDPDLMDDLAGVLVRETKYAEAEVLLNRAVALRERFSSPTAFGDAAGHLAFAASKDGHPQACLQALALRATVLPNSGPSLFLEATAHDTLHQYKEAAKAYRAFLAIAAGQFPDQEFEARHRLVALDHEK